MQAATLEAPATQAATLTAQAAAPAVARAVWA